MDEYEREVFGLLRVREIWTQIQRKINECVAQALDVLGGADTVSLGRELQRLATAVQNAPST